LRGLGGPESIFRNAPDQSIKKGSSLEVKLSADTGQLLSFTSLRLSPFRKVLFTPLESLSAFSGVEDKIPFETNMGFKVQCEPSLWKAEDLLMGFTNSVFNCRIVYK